MSRRDAAAFQDFLVEAKSYWMSSIFPALHDRYGSLAADKAIAEPEQVGEIIADTPIYRYYTWLERHIQREKYAGRLGLIHNIEQGREDLERRLSAVTTDLDLLTLDPSVDVPHYYTVVDTHQHPGNLTGDSLAGYVYKASAGSTQPGQTTGYALHERFADLVAERGDFRRVLDAGCGFGKSAITLARRLPDAVVDGVDLSAPCLTLAAHEASEAQVKNLRYRQADVCRLPYADGAFDLVTSTMLLHELPPSFVIDHLAEAFRLLAPGGSMIHLDFQARDPFLRFIHHGHGRRNNEPYMEAFDRMDLAATLEAAGFVAPAIEPFAETADPNPSAWRLPWTLVTARKP